MNKINQEMETMSEENPEIIEKDPPADPPQPRNTKGQFGGKTPPAPPEPAPKKEDNSDLLIDIDNDLQKQILEKFGKLDLSHLSVEGRIRTMRSMLKVEEPKGKPKISETDDAPPAPEWVPPKTLLEIFNTEGQKLKKFYDQKRSIGGDLWDKIQNVK